MKKAELYEAIGRKVVQIARQAEIVSFAAKAKKGGGKKSQNCTAGKSHSCTRPDGSSYCISLNRKCRAPATGTAKQAADYTAEKVKAAKAPKKAAKAAAAEEQAASTLSTPKNDFDAKVKAFKADDDPAPLPSTEKPRAGTKRIETEEEFTAAVTAIAVGLGKPGEVVPIYKIRRLMPGVDRETFNKFMFDAQEKDKLLLIGGEMPWLTPGKASDSLTTMMGSPRYYAKITASDKEIAAAKKAAAKLDTTTAGKTQKKTFSIKSQADFDKTATDQIKQIDREFNHGGLVPIWKLRERLNMDRDKFDEYLGELQASGKARLEGGNAPSIDSDPQRVKDSYKTVLGTMRYYVKLEN